MKTVNRICWAVCGGILLFAVCFQLLFYKVDVHEAGVLTQQYGVFGSKGVKAEDFNPGWHLDLGPIHTWNTFDMTVQTIEMTRRPDRGDRGGQDAVVLKSSDGYNITLDVTLKFRIKPEMAHALLQELGARTDQHRSIVRNLALETIRDSFGNMRTEDFYNPAIRRQGTREAHARLSAELDARNMELIDILVRDIVFDDQYEQKILQKKLADQDVELNKSMQEAASKRGERQVIEADTQAMVKVIDEERKGELLKMKADIDKQIAQIDADAEKYAAQVRADADLYAAQQIAKGTLLVKQSEARGEQLKADALQGRGGANLVALEATKNLKLGAMTLSTVDTDFLNVQRMVQMLGASGPSTTSAPGGNGAPPPAL
jgi:regulator of protease activity HflC (stomatin/prohibitin superfamily)